ncbi:MAG: hypothetical protein KA140_06155 [Caldisericia bacterium]|nr:hypothetical protein [Caldisericia bacterium]
MLAFDINIDEQKKIIFAKLSGELGDEAKVKAVIDQFLSEVESHKWFNLILDVSELEMPGIQAFSILGKFGKDKLDQAAGNLKKIAVVDNGKVTDMMSAFFMKPPPNMFFDSADAALEFVSRD